MTFKKSVRHLEARAQQRIIRQAVDNTSPHVVEQIIHQSQNLSIRPLSIDLPAFEKYVTDAEYDRRYPEYYAGNLPEKSLEHYVALHLLDLHAGEVFIDLASEHSPVPEIFERHSGARAYSQDIMYPEGVHGRRIGGDACHMPVPDGFARKAALTCSLEHFEKDGDIRLFSELSRVLEPGGRVVVVPFYLFTEPAIQTDPELSVPAGVKFDPECTIYCAKGWGNRHGRFYSPAWFQERIAGPMAEKFRFEVVHLVNARQVDPTVYARFAFTAVRV